MKMVKIPFSIFIFFYYYSLQYLSLIGQVHGSLVPALYIFGDSLSDPGNNIFIKGAKAKPNFKPYGIDFPNGVLGRFTNGFTMADYLAKSLGLPIPPAILDPCSQTTNFTGGFNYASSSAGILPDTGVKAAGPNLCLEHQVELFRKTAQQFLLSRLKKQSIVNEHLQKSIFFIAIGSNDYSLNYANPLLSNNSFVFNPEQFANLLVNELGREVQELYKLGARKFVIAEMGRIGCTPAARKLVHNHVTRCQEQLNAIASIFNLRLANKLPQLTKTLKASNFVTMKLDLSADLIDNPKRYGFKNAENSCCPVGKSFECVENSKPCFERESYVFWDDVHPTDATNKLLARACFNGKGACTPINILQLAHYKN